MSKEAIIPPAKLLEFGITFSPSTLHRREKAGTFPIRVRLGPRHHGYIESQIRAGIAERIAEHEASQPACKSKGEVAYASIRDPADPAFDYYAGTTTGA